MRVSAPVTTGPDVVSLGLVAVVLLAAWGTAAQGAAGRVTP
ncbi:MAG: hypothetical protein JWO76_963 [Nocardioides sp.]|nr:hypothetical protein [Nocardioides sp.]